MVKKMTIFSLVVVTALLTGCGSGNSGNPASDSYSITVDAAYAEVVEDIAGNTNGTAATATQINLIDGVSGAVEARDYTAELQNGTYVDSSNPTAAEIQAVIDVVNA